MAGESELEFVPGRVRLDVKSAYQFTHWFAKLMEPVIMPAAEKKMAGDLARLESLVERSQ